MPVATHAQSETTNTTTIDDAGILDRLNDDDFRVRQAETRRLLADDALTQDDLNHLYSSSSTLEQRHRLLLIARHHMISRLMQERLGDQAGPGSMGLSHQVVQVAVPGEASPRTGVLVVMTLPGFPAYALLEPGDIIVDFAGEPIPQNMTPTQFQQTIKTFQNGQSVGLVVIRDGAAEDILFRLGPGQGLGEVYDTGGVTLKEPYETSWSNLRANMRALVGEHDTAESEGVTTEPIAPANE
ncbi:MAG: PDZ domain-containing protein [Phycisphaerales bacterium]